VSFGDAKFIEDLLDARGVSPSHSDHACCDLADRATHRNFEKSLDTSLWLLGLAGLALLQPLFIFIAKLISLRVDLALFMVSAAVLPVTLTWCWAEGYFDGIPDDADALHRKTPHAHVEGSGTSTIVIDNVCGTAQSLELTSRATASGLPGALPGDGNVLAAKSQIETPGYSNTLQEVRSWILLGLSGHIEHFDLAHLDARASQMANDHVFFAALKSSYARLKGLLRRSLSIWCLSHCEIVKVSIF
jgi:hypothetical protein